MVSEESNMTDFNFTVSDNIAIEKDGDYLDLHSDFDFVNISFDQSRYMLELEWQKLDEDWVNIKGTINKLTLKFNNVSYLSFSNIKSESTLESFGCLHPEDKSIMNGFLPLTEIKSGYDLILLFVDEGSIKVNCDSVTCIVD